MQDPIQWFVVIFALLFPPLLHAADISAKPIKVFILAGQSNMEGKAKVELLERQLKHPEKYPTLVALQKDGKWIERDDVWIKFLDRKGNLTVGYGSPKCIGPELGFGLVMGDHYEVPVLLIKTAWGGRSLWRDFRPPSAGLPSEKVLGEMLANEQKKHPEATMDKIKGEFGASYRAMMEEITKTLGNLKTEFPQYQGQGYEITGFVWFQGWNDMINPTYTAEYADNLEHLIRDVRKDLKSPNLPVVIGEMGVDGMHPGENIQRFKAAEQKAAALPEFAGNVKLVHTDQFWDEDADAIFKQGWQKHREEWDQVGSDYGFHYLGSVRSMLAMGKAMGEGMLELLQAKKGKK